ncbi:MAG: glycosyltransferase [Alphaproteobacteria bacterium]
MMMRLKNKTILFLLPAMEAGGVEGFTIDAAAAVIKAGGQALVASSGGAMVATLNKIGAVHFFMPFKTSWQKFFPLFVLLRLYRLSKSKHVKLIYVASRSPAWYGWMVAKLLRLPLITGFHGIYSGYGFLPKKFYNQVMTWGNAIHAVSFFVEKHIKDIYKPKNPIAVIHGGVDINKIAKHKILDNDKQYADGVLKNIFPHNNNQRIIFMPGRLSHLKGQWFLLKAFSQLLEQTTNDEAKHHQWHDVILLLQSVGKKRHLKKLHNIIAQKKLDGRIGFLPYQENLLPFYDRASLVVNASRRPESFGRTIIEAMALNKITIAPNYGAALEQINDSVNGFLFIAQSSESMAKALKRAFNLSDQQKKSIEVAGRHSVEENFSLSVKQGELVKLMAEVMERHHNIPSSGKARVAAP